MAISETEQEDIKVTLSIVLSISCLVMAAIASGLTLGVCSLDTLKLQIKAETGSKAEKEASISLLPLLNNRHQLLCTLLILNSIANEALPIFLDEMVPNYVAVILSVTFVLLFGEIIPAAIITGPNQLMIASKFTSLIILVKWVLYPLAYPMAVLLDYILGPDSDEVMNREELNALIQITQMNQTSSTTDGDDSNRETLTSHEVNAISGVFSMEKKLAKDIMIPMNKVDMISSDTVLDYDMMKVIDKMGHSRLPVYKQGDRSCIMGYLLVKRLILVNTDAKNKIGESLLTKAIVIGATEKLTEVMDIFQRSHGHLAVISNNAMELQMAIDNGTTPADYCKPLGIITFEDVIENVLNMNIKDEYDRVRDGALGTGSTGLSVNLTKALMRTPAFAKTLTTEINSAMLSRSKTLGGSNDGGSNDVAKDGFKRGTLVSRLGFLSPKSADTTTSSNTSLFTRSNTMAGYLGLSSEPFQVSGKQSLLQQSMKGSSDFDYVAHL